MSADWTTCRVVRDRDGVLWVRNPPYSWVSLDHTSASWESDRLHEAFGPLTHVLDADGLPVVTTVGDLNARHIGRLVQIGPDIIAPTRILATRTYVSLRGFTDDDQWIAIDPMPLDTPCEVLP